MFTVSIFLMHSSLLPFVNCLFVFKYKDVQYLNDEPACWQLELIQCSISVIFGLSVA